MPTPEFVLALREKVGHAELWLPGVTAVTRRTSPVGRTEVLLVQRSDNLAWTPVTGIVDPGEEPGVAARREALEEAGVEIRVDRLAQVTAGEQVSYPNGDRNVFLDHTFACTWVSGEAHVADEESVDVGWFDLDALPAISDRIAQRIEVALSDEVAARFRS